MGGKSVGQQRALGMLILGKIQKRDLIDYIQHFRHQRTILAAEPKLNEVVSTCKISCHKEFPEHTSL